MPSLKDLKNRIASVKSTQKITAAMKMVAASKLRRAQEQAEATRPYAERISHMLETVAPYYYDVDTGPRLVIGTGSDAVQLLIVITSDRGLCGGFNSSIVRESRRRIQQLQADGKTVKLICVGRKGRDQLKRDYGKLIVHSYEDLGKPRLSFADAETITERVLAMYEGGEYDVCSVVYNRFKSVISQIVTIQQLVPVPAPPPKASLENPDEGPTYEFEPDEETLLTKLVPRNLSFQIYRALLESAASEQGARMSAMDNATRNASDMINKLTLNYNRTRQAVITKELIEIISGAEAL
ncbi:MAG: F0F1 ATP synthase subunit gamma [Azospirillum sp.]|nr:F0F1 ATP synthase subunit gamma [Azospirillum sp.]